jgi:hypothetical protein
MQIPRPTRSPGWIRSFRRKALTTDAVDAVRLVRVADSLRQRGSALRTAAGYEIFTDVATGQGVFSLRNSAGDRLCLLRFDSVLSAGEANVRNAAVTRNGDLRISFHRGRFSSGAAADVAGKATARVVADIAADVLGAFAVRPPSPDLPQPARDSGSMRVELERPTDEPAFAQTVADGAALVDPLLRGRIYVVADLVHTSRAERLRYLTGIPIDAESDEAGSILDALETHGMRVGGIDRRQAFEDVRRVVVEEGEPLVEAGSPRRSSTSPSRAACGSSSSAATGTSKLRRGSRSASPASCAERSATARWSPSDAAMC